MGYISPKIAASKWGISPRAVQLFCANDKIPGAVRIGRQWMIPDDAPRPADGRTAAGKQNRKKHPYRFPLLLHTQAFARREELSEEELQLLEAELLLVKGKYESAISACYELLEITPVPCLRFGAYLTICSACVLLGSFSSYQSAFSKAQKICEQETEHQEDYRVLIEFILLLLSKDPRPMQKIDISLLSPDAAMLYRRMMIVLSSATTKIESPLIYSMFESVCMTYHTNGMFPTEMLLHTALAILGRDGETAEKAAKHLRAACEIGVKHEWLPMFGAFYPFIPDKMDAALAEFGQCYVDIVTSSAKQFQAAARRFRQDQQNDQNVKKSASP